eukprot:jgi/Tetstr1/466484/TSEL_010991.t1
MEDEVLHVDDNTAEVVIVDDDAEVAPLAGDAPAAPTMPDANIVWDSKPLVLHAPAKPEAMNEQLQVLQRIEPTLQSLSVTRLKSKNYHAVMKVLKNHTNSSQFFLQFFKHPQPETGTKEFHYMTLEEAFQHGVFTDEHQPSKIAECAAGRGRGRGRGLAGAAPVAGRGRGRPPVAPITEAAPAAQPKAVYGNALSSMVLVQPHMQGMSIAHPSKLRGVAVCQ